MSAYLLRISSEKTFQIYFMIDIIFKWVDELWGKVSKFFDKDEHFY